MPEDTICICKCKSKNYFVNLHSYRFDAPRVSCLKICKVIIGHQRAEDCVYSALYNPFPLRAQLWNCLIRMIKTILSPLLTGFILKCSPHSRFVCFKIVAPDSWHILCVLARQTRHLQNNKYETKLPYNWTKTKTYWTYIYQEISVAGRASFFVLLLYQDMVSRWPRP